jgi:hypothetical protein
MPSLPPENAMTMQEQQTSTQQQDSSSQHLAIPKLLLLLILAHLINAHTTRLARDMVHAVRLVVLIIHRLSVAVTSVLPVRLVEGVAQPRDAHAAEDAEDVALVLVELGRGFAAEDEEVVAQEGLNAGEAEVCEAGAVVEECVDALWLC